MKLIDEMGFDKSFSFIYSKRPGTIAASLPDDVDQTVKKQRLGVIQEKLNENTEKISRLMIGSIQKVLVEGHSKKGSTLSGRTENMRTTHFQGNEDLIGQIVSVKITEGFANSLQESLSNWSALTRALNTSSIDPPPSMALYSYSDSSPLAVTPLLEH